MSLGDRRSVDLLHRSGRKRPDPARHDETANARDIDVRVSDADGDRRYDGPCHRADPGGAGGRVETAHLQGVAFGDVQTGKVFLLHECRHCGLDPSPLHLRSVHSRLLSAEEKLLLPEFDGENLLVDRSARSSRQERTRRLDSRRAVPVFLEFQQQRLEVELRKTEPSVRILREFRSSVDRVHAGQPPALPHHHSLQSVHHQRPVGRPSDESRAYERRVHQRQVTRPDDRHVSERVHLFSRLHHSQHHPAHREAILGDGTSLPGRQGRQQRTGLRQPLRQFLPVLRHRKKISFGNPVVLPSTEEAIRAIIRVHELGIAAGFAGSNRIPDEHFSGQETNEQVRR